MKELSCFIPDEKIAEIRAVTSIVEVISEYVRLHKSGTNYKGLCPFHQEKTPSFFVSEAKKIFHCFGCGASGDVFGFLMQYEKLSFQGAARLLAQKKGIALPERELTPRQRQQMNEREELYSLNQLVAQFYHERLLQDQRGKKARAYLQNRGIQLSAITDFHLGFAPDGWQELVNFLRSRKISLQRAHQAGLLIAKEKEQYYDRFRQRIMFPLFNVAHHVIGFGGRVLDTGEPKYLNSPESYIFNKRHHLYGLHAASRFIAQQNLALIVEGYFDVISLHQAGIKYVVAPLGTALTEHHILMLKRYTPHIITVFDADRSGEKAMIRSLTPFLSCGISPQMILLPEGHDPDSFVRNYDAQAFIQLIGAATPLIDFVVEQIIKKHQITSPQGKIQASAELIPLLENMRNEVERDFYIQKIASRLGIKEAYILKKLGKTAERSYGHTEKIAAAKAETAEELLSVEEKAERLIIELMILHPEIIPTVEENDFLEEFTSGVLQETGRRLCAMFHECGGINLPEFMQRIQDEAVHRLITAVSFKEGCGGNPFKILEDCIHRMRLQKLRRKREETKALLKKAEDLHDDVSCQQFQLYYQQLIEEEKRIHRFRIIP